MKVCRAYCVYVCVLVLGALLLSSCGVVGLIRFRGHRPKGGYDGQNGIKAGRETSATTVL